MGKTTNLDYTMIEKKVKKEVNKYLNNEECSSNILENMDSERLIKGIILSEILGKPVSKRRRRR